MASSGRGSSASRASIACRPAAARRSLLVERHLFDQPNGLCFSPDERLLYVNDTVQALIRAFDVEADGSLANARVFASGIRSELEPGLPDGMKCDQRGNVWVTAPGGVWVYSPAGDLLGKVRVPELVANLTWGGADFRTLYLTATHSVYAIPTKVGPRHEPYMSGQRGGTGAASRRAAPHLNWPAATCSSIPQRCAMIIQDLQNDVIMEGGAFADFRLARPRPPADAWSTMSAASRRPRARAASSSSMSGSSSSRARPASRSTRRCSRAWSTARRWCAAAGVRRRFRGWSRAPGDFVVEKMRMSAWEGTRLETILKATGRDMIINTGAWTNMSVEHTARTGADKGYFMVVPEDCCSTMNADWHNASINFALQNVSVVTNADAVIKALG